MRNVDKLLKLAEENGWKHWDTSSKAYVPEHFSHTFGIEEIACIHVRFDSLGRVKNAIYVHFEERNQEDQYIFNRQKDKMEKIEYVLRNRPKFIPILLSKGEFDDDLRML